ncbi:Eco57I restriction-modification methylase domain-containing protein [Pareuzebyella sediminis]|uniref:Eco57I restriction-modification methylase domain-containing protein n=1 Tax=Pareuzebyella sediminis TaxID=2607998 RepID=UPI0011ED5BF4|nr:DNA methyltransferase [Pareuzebyella sediminis]
MPIFQTSVLKKYLSLQDNLQVEKAYQDYSSYFLNPQIQENIRNSKEEQFQEGFLRELFVKILGYTLNPDPNFNLTTELKNEKGSKKTDGAILKDGKALGVVELKGTDTKDLDKVNEQAFSYKNNHTDCVYVITSNFEKLRFFIHNAVEHIEFNLFNLGLDEFKVLWLCLQAENLLNGIPQKVKEESLLAEENITKQLYKDYSAFKTALWQNMVKNHHGDDALMLFKKTQKLLDRFLFIFFAEDSGLLPPNSIRKIIDKWKDDTDWGDDRKLYDIFKQYFGFINGGRPAKGDREAIFGYNGGLFMDDLILDKINIDDDVLLKYTEKLSAYDFQSEVDVNILGHIFENSLNEIENITAELEGKEIEKSKTKRKKDGVFYTPKYITKYIVDNTLGKLCEDKKAELNITDERFGQASKRSRKGIDDLQAYRDWLLDLKICDPACGSGAFLNQALEFLIDEHRYLDELTAQYHKSPLVLSDIETQILEQNIYGVDINEESVEIAKLSLWLRTAQKGRKLTSLNNNIKCGNSLIDEPEVAGKKAFNWQKEFPKVFEKGGFDVIIGNPPYVRQELLGEFKGFFEQRFKVFEGTSDLFAYFYEQGFKLLKSGGAFGFISNTFDKTKAASKLREYLQEEVKFESYIDFTEVQIFEGATTYPIILIAKNTRPDNSPFDYLKIDKSQQGKIIQINPFEGVEVAQNSLDPESWSFNSLGETSILDKMKINKSVREKYGKCFRGIVTGYNEAFIIDKSTKTILEAEHPNSSRLIKPFYEGKDLEKWHSNTIEKYIIFTRRGTNIDEFPAIKNYLNAFKERLTPRNSPEIKIGRKPGPYEWFEIQDSVDYFKKFEEPKITWPNLQNKNKFCIDLKGYYINAPSVILPSASKPLLCILNSKLVWTFLKSICVVRSGGYIEVKPQYFEQIPIPDIENEELFESSADKIINLTDNFQKTETALIQLLQSKFEIEKPSKKLQNWHELEFKDFLKELKKAKVQLSLSEEAEWMAYFNEQRQKAQVLKAQIDQIDKEIDQMVYELYGLNEDEIKIIEGN